MMDGGIGGGSGKGGDGFGEKRLEGRVFLGVGGVKLAGDGERGEEGG
jgi:hypothetical protein